MTQDKGYPDFDEYIRQGEPSKRESAYAWSTAIGLQAVDGLKTSEYLNELARRNIEGEITMDEVSKLLDIYYKSKTVRETGDKGTEEADKASKNIKKILSTVTLDFTANGLINIHRRIFEGVFKHAGELRKYDITKREWVLEGDTVRYLNWEDLLRALDYDIKQEKEYSYHGVATEDVVKHLTGFVAGLWQIHPFREGNTERFFRNLLLGEQWDLRNRFLHVHAPKEWGVQPILATPTSTRTTTRTSNRISTRTSSIVSGFNSNSKFYTDNEIIIELVRVVGNDELSVKQMMELAGLKHRQNFLEYHLEPALREKFIRRKFPDNPNHPRQRYLLTVKGQALYNELINLDN